MTTEKELEDNYREREAAWRAMKLQALKELLAVLVESNVTRYRDDTGLELELQPESKLVTLDELMGESKDQPKRPKTPYEQALERAAGVPEDEVAQ